MAFLTKEQKFKLKHGSVLVLIGIVIGVVIMGIILANTVKKYKSEKPEDNTAQQVMVIEDGEGEELTVTMEYLEKKLSNLSELSTAEMVYSGLCTVESGKIPFITKKGFSMVYQGNVKAGIDVSDITKEITSVKVTVTLPPAEVQESHVDPKTVQFYDEKHALFNRDEKTDVTAAIALAEEDMKNNANTDGLINRADQQAELIVQGLLEDAIGKRTLEIKHGKALN